METFTPWSPHGPLIFLQVTLNGTKRHIRKLVLALIARLLLSFHFLLTLTHSADLLLFHVTVFWASWQSTPGAEKIPC